MRSPWRAASSNNSCVNCTAHVFAWKMVTKPMRYGGSFLNAVVSTISSLMDTTYGQPSTSMRELISATVCALATPPKTSPARASAKPNTNKDRLTSVRPPFLVRVVLLRPSSARLPVLFQHGRHVLHKLLQHHLTGLRVSSRGIAEHSALAQRPHRERRVMVQLVPRRIGILTHGFAHVHQVRPRRQHPRRLQLAGVQGAFPHGRARVARRGLLDAGVDEVVAA